MTPAPGTRTGADLLCAGLADAGVELVVGLPGTQTVPIDEAIARRDDVRYVMARHETAIPHVAWGYAEAGGGVAATVTVPGPGDTNAMHGLKNALEDCVPVIHVSPDVDPADRGKAPIHEIDPATYDDVVKANVQVDRARDLPAAVARATAVARMPPTGPVRLGVPSGMLAAPAEASLPTHEPDRALVDALSAPVVASFKGKGVVPGDDDRVLGVAGSHLPSGAVDAMAAADVVVALGADFDGVATDGWSLPAGDALVHVTLDPDDVDAGYEADVAIIDDVAAAASAMRAGIDLEAADRWDGARVGAAVWDEYEAHLADAGLLDENGPATTPATLRAVRAALPREAVVTTDVGGFRLWALQAFGAYGPERFVTPGSWAGMGVGLPAAVGAALADPPGPVVSLTGDGGLLMCLQALHTAVEEDLDLLVVVLDNADYAAISAQVESSGDEPAFGRDPPSFETVAAGLGCRATTVDTPADAREAVDAALARDGVDLVDVRLVEDEPTAAEVASYESSVEFGG